MSRYFCPMSTYHHGDLRRELLSQAAAMAAETGPQSVTLRELARRAGVSHSAPVHHFGNRQNLLTSLAIEGFDALNEALDAQAEDIYRMGVAYVRWALEHPGYYAVMWQPRELADDEELHRARGRAWELLAGAVAGDAGGEAVVGAAEVDAYAAFAVVHGLSGIWLSGALPLPDDPEQLTRSVTQRLVFHAGGTRTGRSSD